MKSIRADLLAAERVQAGPDIGLVLGGVDLRGPLVGEHRRLRPALDKSIVTFLKHTESAGTTAPYQGDLLALLRLKGWRTNSIASRAYRHFE